VDDGNGKFNLMLLAWNNGQTRYWNLVILLIASSIHDHAGAHCFMKVLGGNVDQDLYDVPGHLTVFDLRRISDMKGRRAYAAQIPH
jgi:cysteine dioxygenase